MHTPHQGRHCTCRNSCALCTPSATQRLWAQWDVGCRKAVSSDAVSSPSPSISTFAAGSYSPSSPSLHNLYHCLSTYTYDSYNAAHPACPGPSGRTGERHRGEYRVAYRGKTCLISSTGTLRRYLHSSQPRLFAMPSRDVDRELEAACGRGSWFQRPQGSRVRNVVFTLTLHLTLRSQRDLHFCRSCDYVTEDIPTFESHGNVQ